MSILPQLEHCSSKKMNTWLGVWGVVGQGQQAGGDRGLRKKGWFECPPLCLCIDPFWEWGRVGLSLGGAGGLKQG